MNILKHTIQNRLNSRRGDARSYWAAVQQQLGTVKSPYMESAIQKVRRADRIANARAAQRGTMR